MVLDHVLLLSYPNHDIKTRTGMIRVTLNMPSACCESSGNFTLSGEWSPCEVVMSVSDDDISDVVCKTVFTVDELIMSSLLCVRYGFRSKPELVLFAKPWVGDREVNLSPLTDWIEKKLAIEFQV